MTPLCLLQIAAREYIRSAVTATNRLRTRGVGQVAWSTSQFRSGSEPIPQLFLPPSTNDTPTQLRQPSSQHTHRSICRQPRCSLQSGDDPASQQSSTHLPSGRPLRTPNRTICSEMHIPQQRRRLRPQASPNTKAGPASLHKHVTRYSPMLVAPLLYDKKYHQSPLQGPCPTDSGRADTHPPGPSPTSK
jgi:hypothetical protein